MTKKEKHRQDLIGLFGEFAETGDPEIIADYVVTNSNLPGRRANLELAEAFGDAVEHGTGEEDGKLWELCMGLTGISADEAPVNAPREFLPFCGAIGVGSIGAVSPAFCEQALATLKTLANDPPWRMREAVCFGLQRLLAIRSQDTLQNLEGWVIDGSLLEMRAVAAVVAHPALLKNERAARAALRVHETIVKQILELEERKSEGFRVLRKALGYTLSVVVCAVPMEGFELMAQLIATHDSDLLWIVKQNLRKNRLVRSFPQEVKSTLQLLD